MKTVYGNAKIYDSDAREFFRGAVETDGGIISNVWHWCDDADIDGKNFMDLDGAYVVPGLVDVHTHGRVGGDFCSADAEMLVKMSHSYLEHGVTTVIPTLASAPLDELMSASDRISQASVDDCSVFAGIHLEGRYLNPQKRGAHAESLLARLDGEELKRLISRMLPAGTVHISAALELDFDESFTRAALESGATLGLAHTAATYSEAEAAFRNGATSLTHTYNAMSPLHHRDVGAVGAGLLNGRVFCELIADGFHVSPEAVKLAYVMKGEKLVLITDSMEATGEPDGEYGIAGMPVTVKNGKAMTHDGAIAGSTLELLDGVKNLAKFADIPFAEAIYCATASPAKEVGLYGRIGSVDVGKAADLLILDEGFNTLEVIFKGNKI